MVTGKAGTGERAPAAGPVWFKPELVGTPQALTLGQLEYYKRNWEAKDLAMYHPGQTWLLGYAIPPFQRPLVWSEEQKVRFVESAARGLHLGTWVYNDAMGFGMEQVEGREVMPRTDRWLIDGQQRLNALDEFFDDKFPVFGLTWSQVPQTERRRFLNQNFAAQQIQSSDEMELRRLYDRLNFGGTPHTPDQRAVPVEEDEPAGPAFR